MSDRACDICGSQLENAQPFTWQGQEAFLCFECWDQCIGTGEPDDYPEETESDPA